MNDMIVNHDNESMYNEQYDYYMDCNCIKCSHGAANDEADFKLYVELNDNEEQEYQYEEGPCEECQRFTCEGCPMYEPVTVDSSEEDEYHCYCCEEFSSLGPLELRSCNCECCQAHNEKTMQQVDQAKQTEQDEFHDFLLNQDPYLAREMNNWFEKTITFVELATGSMALIDEERRWIYFPQDFTAIPGRKYDCSVRKTVTGAYVYQGTNYRVCRAHLKDASDAMTSYRDQEQSKPEESPFAALKGFQIAETYKVTASISPKGDKISLEPVYKDQDAYFDDQPTMYFLNPPSNVQLEEGKKYTVKVESKNSTGRYNRRNALMVNVQVAI